MRISSLPRFTRVLAGSLCLLSFIGAGHADEKAVKRPAFTPPPKSGIPVDYRKLWPQLSKLAVSGMHWNHWVVVYSNMALPDYRANQQMWWAQEQSSGWVDESQGQQQGFHRYQPGTVLVKEGFSGTNADKLNPTFLAIMIKHEPGFDPEYGDWEFVQSTPQGKVLLRGSMSSPGMSTACGNCHMNVAERDFVFATTGMGSH